MQSSDTVITAPIIQYHTKGEYQSPVPTIAVHRPSVTEYEIKNQSNSEITHPEANEPVEEISQRVPDIWKEVERVAGEEREVEEEKQLEEEAYVPQVVPYVVKEEHKPQYSAWDASRLVVLLSGMSQG